MGKITHKRIAGSSNNSAMMKDERPVGLLGNMSHGKKGKYRVGVLTRRTTQGSSTNLVCPGEEGKIYFDCSIVVCFLLVTTLQWINDLAYHL